jgi:hypothetical protein
MPYEKAGPHRPGPTVLSSRACHRREHRPAKSRLCRGSCDGASGSIDTPPNQRRQTRIDLAQLVGLVAVAFTAVYFISDLIEVAQGGFSTFRLALTYAGEAAIPFFVIGLYAVQRPRIGRLGFLGAIAYDRRHLLCRHGDRSSFNRLDLRRL